MHYEHLLQINDPSDPQIEPLTREQLWLGLIARAVGKGDATLSLIQGRPRKDAGE